MSAIGSIEFSFERSELLYRFGLNFHQVPTFTTLREVQSPIIRIDTGDPEISTGFNGIAYDPAIQIAGPQYNFKVDPMYPEMAKNAGQEGEVVLQVIITEKGIPIDIIAQTDLGLGLGEAAIEALKKTTFYPAITGGVPIPIRVSIRYRFTLRHQ